MSIRITQRLRDRACYPIEAQLYERYLDAPWALFSDPSSRSLAAAVRAAWRAANDSAPYTFSVYEYLLGLSWVYNHEESGEEMLQRLQFIEYVHDQRWRYYGKPGLVVATKLAGLDWRALDNGVWRPTPTCAGRDAVGALEDYIEVTKEYAPKYVPILVEELQTGTK